MAKSVKKRKLKGPTAQELAGRTFTVRVTRKDILKGKPQSISFCPIALALTRATGVRDVAVDDYAIKVDGLPEIQDLPVKISEFVLAFDQDTDPVTDENIPALKRVRPFKFDITLPIPPVEEEEGRIEIL